MSRTMINAVNTLAELQKKMDVTSQNIANVNTYGYKRQAASFGDLLHQQVENMGRTNEDVGRNTPIGIRLGTGAYLAQTKWSGAQGAIEQTGRSLDFALTNPGMLFKVLVQDEQGNGTVHYTRDGSFSAAPFGENQVMLVTSEGYPVLDENNNPITATEAGMQKEAADRIGLVQAANPQMLTAVSQNLLALQGEAVTENQVLQNVTGAARSTAGIQQSALEQSNVDIARELTDLTITQRSYQFQSKSISIADQMLGLVNGIR